ncbi:MAG: hypothetical protein QM715_03475 [Nibricoccus sp.]
MQKLLRRNGLSIAVMGLFLVTFLGGQLLTGLAAYNDDRSEHGETKIGLLEYLASAHFLEATAENWESEFLQIFVYVYITAFLFQKGSAESNDPDKPREQHRITPDSPWPARKGGLWLKLYSHSLSLAFALLFFGSFWLHLCGSVRLENEERARLGLAAISLKEHLGGAKFWFESFQNWQSEFLAIGSMVILSIFLREKDSPESKPVEAPHSETGG